MLKAEAWEVKKVAIKQHRKEKKLNQPNNKHSSHAHFERFRNIATVTEQTSGDQAV